MRDGQTRDSSNKAGKQNCWTTLSRGRPTFILGSPDLHSIIEAVALLLDGIKAFCLRTDSAIPPMTTILAAAGAAILV
jgi:hypothetical protein